MIIRHNKISLKADFVKFEFSLSISDLKEYLLLYLEMVSLHDTDMKLQAKEEPITELGLRYFFEHHPAIFANFNNPYREQLSAWAWHHLLKEKYIISSATNDTDFYFTEKAFVKRGRPAAVSR